MYLFVLFLKAKLTSQRTVKKKESPRPNKTILLLGLQLNSLHYFMLKCSNGVKTKIAPG